VIELEIRNLECGVKNSGDIAKMGSEKAESSRLKAKDPPLCGEIKENLTG
jgi:hypothetical protein